MYLPELFPHFLVLQRLVDGSLNQSQNLITAMRRWILINWFYRDINQNCQCDRYNGITFNQWSEYFFNQDLLHLQPEFQSGHPLSRLLEKNDEIFKPHHLLCPCYKTTVDWLRFYHINVDDWLGDLQNNIYLSPQTVNAAVEEAIYGISKDIDALELAENLDSLRGYEGISAARYFPAFGELITNRNFEFSLRNRQPPKDPINSLLSFGYTLLLNNVMSFIVAEGLSPYIGNFHYGERQKSYLAFDLMEEFRSIIVDSLVMNIINHSVFKPHDFDFVESTEGVYLNQSSRRVFLQKFEARMNEETSHPDLQSKITYRHAIQLQVRRYKRHLLSNIPYAAFLRPA
ncbi:CRISPR-associated endonuclease Cas1 (plasmid) [Okeanomitos corallinicola TIOX110]|uniref:CRISPR-associated endonuclease Cas1 n=1 Tax=Okeanomitos corallinicola TIOX110 TaxID=3133117 RepID=A0ABZ2UY72_9CYAN